MYIFHFSFKEIFYILVIFFNSLLSFQMYIKACSRGFALRIQIKPQSN